MSEEVERNWKFRTSSVQVTAQMEDVHIVEFINWKSYTVCNTQINGVWYTCSFPATTTIMEFLIEGKISTARNWNKGRIYQDI